MEVHFISLKFTERDFITSHYNCNDVISHFVVHQRIKLLQDHNISFVKALLCNPRFVLAYTIIISLGLS